MWASDPWSWTGLWHWMGQFIKVILALLAVMLVHAFAIGAERVWRFNAVTRRLPTLLDIVGRSGGSASIASAIAAAQSLRHPLARIVVSGLETFNAAPSSFSDSEALDAAHRAMQRTGSLARSKMKYGLSTLATISALAPFVGLSGTIIGLGHAFGGGGMQRDALRSAIANNVAIGLIPTAISLIVGVASYAIYNHLVRRLELFDVEASVVPHRVLSYLCRNMRQRPEAVQVTFADPRQSEARFDRYSVLLLSVGGVWLYVVYVLVFGICWSLTHPYY